MTDALFDMKALARNRARAARAPALFLHERVADQLSDRLKEVNRTFSWPALVSAFPDFWRASWPEALHLPPEDVLDLKPGAHDLVIHALALHWANDPLGQIIQCRRALRPDGLFLGALFGGETLHELRRALAGAEAELAGGLRPRVAPMAGLRDLGALLMRAQLALPVADSEPIRVTYEGLSSLVHDLRAMGEGNALTGRARGFSRRALFDRAEEIYRQHYSDADGRLCATFELIWLTGWAESDNQQKPLRPGSAAMRLAEALGTTEFTAGDPPGEGS